MRKPEELLTDITELMELVEDRPLRKGATVHGEAKAQHHEKLAELHGRIADLHSRMRAHYATGAAGAHTSSDDDDANEDDAASGHRCEDAADDDVTDEQLAILKAKVADGDLASRVQLDALAKVAIRATLRRPHQAADGVVVGRRGFPLADL